MCRSDPTGVLQLTRQQCSVLSGQGVQLTRSKCSIWCGICSQNFP